MKRIYLVLVSLLLLLGGTVSVPALSIPGIDLFGGLVFVGNGHAEGGPSPLLGYWGVGMPVKINENMYFGPELSMFSTQYQLTSDRSKAVPTEVEYADSLWMVSLLLDTSFRYLFKASDTLYLGPSGHLGFLFRIPILGYGLAAMGSTDPTYRTSIVSYFYSQLRFLLPGVGFRLYWTAFERLGFLFRLTGYFPVFHLWDGEGAPFYDQMIVSGTVGVRFQFE